MISLLEDNIMMAAAAQGPRDLIRVLAEVFRARGQDVPVVTAADFRTDDDDCGLSPVIYSVATGSLCAGAMAGIGEPLVAARVIGIMGIILILALALVTPKLRRF